MCLGTMPTNRTPLSGLSRELTCHLTKIAHMADMASAAKKSKKLRPPPLPQLVTLLTFIHHVGFRWHLAPPI
jgi:hypothetical protein